MTTEALIDLSVEWLAVSVRFDEATKLLALERRLTLLRVYGSFLCLSAIIMLKLRARMLNFTALLAPPNSSSSSMKSSSMYSKSESEFEAC